MPLDITPEQLRAWIINADPDTWNRLFFYLEDIIYKLEDDDFFGTEGFNKRFA